MNVNKLLPVGIALLSALPLAAQTNEPSAPPAPPSIAVPPLPPMPPMPPMPPLPPMDGTDMEADMREFEADLKEFELDAKEFEMDAKEFELDAADFELDAADFKIDAEDFKLDSEDFDMLPEGLSIQMDSLQQQIREQLRNTRERMRAERDVQREVRRIERDIRQKNRELQRMESQMNGDTATLRESLLQAEQALQTARESLKQIAPHAAAVSITVPNVRVSVNTDENGEQHHIVVMGDGTVANNGKNVSMTCKSICSASGGKNGGTMILEGNNAGSGNIWKREDRVVVISTSDSAETAAQGSLPAGSNSQIIIRNFNDTDGEKRSRTIYIRSFSSEGTDLASFPLPPSQSAMAPFKLGNNLILIGNDSLRLQDGSNEQMLIKVYHDSTSPKVKTSMIVITMARGKKVDTLNGGTSDVPELTEMSSASSSSAGYTLEANRPNPFSESTTINFVVPKEEHVNLTVFDAAGKPVKELIDEVVPAGPHSITCDARDLPSGLYLYRLVGGSFSETKTMTVTK